MLALSAFRFARVVATATAIDQMITKAYPDTFFVMRIAPDELLVSLDLGTGLAEVYEYLGPIDDAHAIVELDSGLSGVCLEPHEFASMVLPKMEWHWDRTTIGQGLLHQVPVKMAYDEETDCVTLICGTTHVHELQERV